MKLKKLVPLITMVLSMQAFAEDSCPLTGGDIDTLLREAVALEEYALVRALNRCGTSDSTDTDRRLIDNSARKWLGVSETYNIDRLKIETNVRTSGCETGSTMRMSLSGMIGPDSSFAVDKLLRQFTPCRDEGGNLVGKTLLNLNSGGGFLRDGYKLGRTLKKYNVRAKIQDDSICASSCAVAFLGAVDRILEDTGKIMFHAPYFSGKNEYGEVEIDCNVGDESLTELKDYYISMTDAETGERLFERTMWYCSANDGWVVTGGAAAELYGIATER